MGFVYCHALKVPRSHRSWGAEGGGCRLLQVLWNGFSYRSEHIRRVTGYSQACPPPQFSHHSLKNSIIYQNRLHCLCTQWSRLRISAPNLLNTGNEDGLLGFGESAPPACLHSVNSKRWAGKGSHNQNIFSHSVWPLTLGQKITGGQRRVCHILMTLIFGVSLISTHSPPTFLLQAHWDGELQTKRKITF